jgi:hypothetical protein
MISKASGNITPSSPWLSGWLKNRKNPLHLQECGGPAMQETKRHRSFAFSALMDKMDS